jgi:uncharacterized protein (TIGR02996 family)
MSEDEAFIRAIVDSPGDDTPRLVYADWLDDRADPRGPYLRAELETVNSLRSREDLLVTVEERDELSVGLDTVWVARVSRPPVGACCDQLEFVNSGPQLCEADVEGAERAVGLEITGAHRAFLLNYNGGSPVRRDPSGSHSREVSDWNYFTSIFPPQPGEDWRDRVCHPAPGRDVFDFLLQSQRERRDLVYLASWVRSLLTDPVEVELYGAGPNDVPWQADVLPLTRHTSYFQLFYAARGRYEGLVQFHDWTAEWCRFGWVAGPHGPPTLPEFLHHVPQSGWGLTETYPSQPLQEFWKA